MSDKTGPAVANSHLFFIGQNSIGRWVIWDECGIRGGVFTDRTSALKFACRETRTDSVSTQTVVGTPFELFDGETPSSSFAAHRTARSNKAR